MRILGVDDDDISLDILEAAVTADGHEMVRAANGLEALDILQHEKIQFHLHCILMYYRLVQPQ